MNLYEEYLNFVSKDEGDEPVTPPLAKRIVFSIMDDFLDRRGLKHAFEACDDDIKDEIIQVWINIVKAELDNA